MVNLTRYKPQHPALQYFDYFTGALNCTVLFADQGPEHYKAETEEKRPWLVEQLEKANNRGGDIYLCVNEVAQWKDRKAENIVVARALFGDDDKPRATARTMFPIQPSLVVKTSATNLGAKYHYYWLIKDAPPLDEWARSEHGLVKAFEFDPVARDRARILRVPGFKNHKYSECIAELVEQNNDGYDWEELMEHFPPVNISEGSETPVNAKKSVEDCIRSFLNPQEIGDISNNMNSVIYRRIMGGATVTEVKQELKLMFNNVPPEIKAEHKERYELAWKQIAKFIGTAKTARSKERSKNRQKKDVQQQEDSIRDMPFRRMDSELYPNIELTRDCAPETLFRAAEECNKVYMNGVAPNLVAGLLTGSAVLNKNVKIIQIADTMEDFCYLGVILAMETGTRKTQTFKKMCKPLFEYEDAIKKQWTIKRASVEARYKGEEATLKGLHKMQEKIRESAKYSYEILSKDEAYLALQNEEALCRDRMRELEAQLVEPQLVIENATAEVVPKAMSYNGGHLASFSDDARAPIQLLLGKYNSSTEESWIIQSMGGHLSRYDRVKDGGTSYTLKDPCLNLLWMVQPDKAHQLMSSPVYLESGLAARIPIYYHNVDILKLWQEINRENTLDDSVLQPYYDSLKKFFKPRRDNPLIVTFAEPQNEIERINGPKKMLDNFTSQFITNGERYGYTLQQMTNYFNKIGSQAGIAATIMAAIDDPAFAEAYEQKDKPYYLPAKYVKLGINLIERLYINVIQSKDQRLRNELDERTVRFTRALLRCYSQKQIWEGFPNKSYFHQRFPYLNDHPNIKREQIFDRMTELGWVTRRVATEKISLNQGFPGGILQPGEPIYHLRVNEVQEELNRLSQLQEKREEIANKLESLHTDD